MLSFGSIDVSLLDHYWGTIYNVFTCLIKFATLLLQLIFDSNIYILSRDMRCLLIFIFYQLERRELLLKLLVLCLVESRYLVHMIILVYSYSSDVDCGYLR